MRKVICAVHVYINLVCVNRRGVGEGGGMVCGCSHDVSLGR